MLEIKFRKFFFFQKKKSKDCQKSKLYYNLVQTEAKSIFKKVFMKLKVLSEKRLKTLKNPNLHGIQFKMKNDQKLHCNSTP